MTARLVRRNGHSGSSAHLARINKRGSTTTANVAKKWSAWQAKVPWCSFKVCLSRIWAERKTDNAAFPSSVNRKPFASNRQFTSEENNAKNKPGFFALPNWPDKNKNCLPVGVSEDKVPFHPEPTAFMLRRLVLLILPVYSLFASSERPPFCVHLTSTATVKLNSKVHTRFPHPIYPTKPNLIRCQALELTKTTQVKGEHHI